MVKNHQMRTNLSSNAGQEYLKNVAIVSEEIQPQGVRFIILFCQFTHSSNCTQKLSTVIVVVVVKVARICGTVYISLLRLRLGCFSSGETSVRC